MKINIKNLLFQPLALHLATDGEGLHLSARECKEIVVEHVSEDIERAAARGLVSLIGGERASGGENAERVSESVAPVGPSQAKQRKGKLR